MRTRWKGFRSVLAPHIDRYIQVKRAAGRKFLCEIGELRLFDRFVHERRIRSVHAITTRHIDAYLASRPRTRPRSYNHLLGAVRRLFRWLVVQGELSRSPVCQRPRRDTSRRIPFIFAPDDARRLLACADTLPTKGGTLLRGLTYRTMFAVLYALGLRIGEACRLQCQDVDQKRQLLVVRDTKFGKSRLVPFGPNVGALLAEYLERRFSGESTPPSDAPVFSLRGKRSINPCTVSLTFHAMLPKLDLATRPGVAPPRLHDLRHSCAVRALLRWYRQGEDPSTRLLHLSTFLGHANTESTAVYLTITSELLEEASQRFERYAQVSSDLHKR
jgi:site-specific recombinase XerD